MCEQTSKVAAGVSYGDASRSPVSLRSRIFHEIHRLESQLAQAKADLTALDAMPQIEAADELNRKYR